MVEEDQLEQIQNLNELDFQKLKNSLNTCLDNGLEEKSQSMDFK